MRANISSLLPGTMPLSRREHDGVHAEVLWVDHYGNAQLNVDPEELEHLGGHLELVAHGRPNPATLASTFAEVPTGGVGLIVDSYGLVAAVASRASAAEACAIAAGDEVLLRPSAQAAPAPLEVGVELGRPRTERNVP